jgi:hypothetical protein
MARDVAGGKRGTGIGRTTGRAGWLRLTRGGARQGRMAWGAPVFFGLTVHMFPDRLPATEYEEHTWVSLVSTRHYPDIR